MSRSISGSSQQPNTATHDKATSDGFISEEGRRMIESGPGGCYSAEDGELSESEASNN